jgi:hypothetical protein
MDVVKERMGPAIKKQEPATNFKLLLFIRLVPFIQIKNLLEQRGQSLQYFQSISQV